MLWIASLTEDFVFNVGSIFAESGNLKIFKFITMSKAFYERNPLTFRLLGKNNIMKRKPWC